MAHTSPPPLSPTVSSVFAKFLETLEDENVLNNKARQSFAKCLQEQTLDHETMRIALFTPDSASEAE